MPRQRLIMIVWMIGVVLCLGAWLHSQFRGSSIGYCRPNGSGVRLSLYLGTIEVHRGDLAPGTPPGVFSNSEAFYPSAPATGDKNALGKIDYFVGPLGEFDWSSHPSSTYLALPLWALLLLYNSLFLLLYLLARRNLRFTESKS